MGHRLDRIDVEDMQKVVAAPAASLFVAVAEEVVFAPWPLGKSSCGMR